MNGKRPLRASQAGFSITELMVAVAVSMILLAGVIQLLITNKHAYRLQEGTSILNENGRYALQRLQHDMRMAGNWAGAAKDDARAHTDLSGLPSTDDCAKRLAMALDMSSELRGIEGIEGDVNSPFTDCIDELNYVDNSDIIIVRFSEPVPVPFADPDTANGGVCDWIDAADCREDLFLRSSVGFNAVVAKGRNMAAAALANPALNQDPSNPAIANYRYRAYAYYVRPCQILSGAVCNAAVDSTPTLVRVALDGTAPVHEDLVAGVEQMQAIYGVDLDNDGNADRYFPASGVNDWNLVVSVRANLLLRSPDRDVAHTSPATYGMLDNFTYTVPTTERDFHRKQHTTVVQVRNLTRS